MADEADVASENEQMMLQAILANGRQGVERQLAARPDGGCLNDCGDPAMQDAAFCSKECAEDVEKRMRLSGRTGSFLKTTDEPA